MTKRADARSSTTLQSVERALAVLELVATSTSSMTVAEVAAELDLNSSTCHNLVRTLESKHYLRRDAKHCLWLDVAVGRLVTSAQLTSFDETIQGVLQDLVHLTGETCFASEWEGNDLVVRHVAEGSLMLRVTGLHAGMRGSAHSRAGGKAVLALLPPEELNDWLRRNQLEPLTRQTIVDVESLEKALADVRRNGYATDLEEFADGVCCVAAPYRSAQGAPLGAVAVAASKDRFASNLTSYADAVKAAAERVEGAAATSLDLRGADALAGRVVKNL